MFTYLYTGWLLNIGRIWLAGSSKQAVDSIELDIKAPQGTHWA